MLAGDQAEARRVTDRAAGMPLGTVRVADTVLRGDTVRQAVMDRRGVPHITWVRCVVCIIICMTRSTIISPGVLHLMVAVAAAVAVTSLMDRVADRVADPREVTTPRYELVTVLRVGHLVGLRVDHLAVRRVPIPPFRMEVLERTVLFENRTRFPDRFLQRADCRLVIRAASRILMQ